MDERLHLPDRTHRSVRTAIGVLAAALVIFAVPDRGAAEEYRDPCDSSKTSWQPDYERTRVRIDQHGRDGHVYHSGTAAEALQFTSVGTASAGSTSVRLTHPVPRSLVVDELRASVWVRANRAGAVLAARISLPHQLDPETGAPLAFDLRGDEYKTATQWQQLTCQTLERAVEQQLTLLRGRLARSLDGQAVNLRDMHVSQLVLVVPVERGTTQLLLDDLQYGPIIRFEDAGRSSSVIQAGSESAAARPPSPIRIETNRMLVNGAPFFLRAIPYHGENLQTLSGVGANVAWIQHYDDAILTSALAERGIWSMAAPPRPVTGDATQARPTAGLMPIPASTSSILFWNVGTRVAPRQLGAVEQWVEQIRDADRAFASPRPVVVDVIGEERRFSRHVSMLGNSRHTLHTTVPPLQYHNYLEHKQKLALPDRFNWTWIETEPADGNLETRSPSRHRPVVVEAEQIWWQAWAAVSVGHKGIGFWTTSSLDADAPGAEERRLALALLNAQLDLLEPWLATGKLDDFVPVSVTLKQSPDLGRGGYSFRNSKTSREERDSLLAERQREHNLAARVPTEVRAAVIQSPYGRLVIPVWYEDGAQFQPGQMAAQDVKILVRGDEAHAWQVTTTAVTPVESERVTGGTELHLPMIDQHAFIVITSDAGLEDKLVQRMKIARQRCGRLWVQLADARLKRVQDTHAAIEQTAAPKVPDAPFLLASAGRMADQARQQLEAEQYAEARRFSRYALQLLRKLQRTHWENAAAQLTAPTSSPHAICFETLPDHWRLMAAIGRSSEGVEENLLRSGDFEDLDTMAVDGWEQQQTIATLSHQTLAELHEDAAQGNFCLRLRSVHQPGAVPVERVGPDVVVVSPKLAVRGGQIVLVTGRVRVDRIAEREIDGLMVYDNILGTVGALRWVGPSAGRDWQSFQLIREVPSTRDLQLTFELHGEGDARFDDVRVMVLGDTLQIGSPAPATPSHGQRRNLLDFAPSLPKVPLWPGKKSAD